MKVAKNHDRPRPWPRFLLCPHPPPPPKSAEPAAAAPRLAPGWGPAPGSRDGWGRLGWRVPAPQQRRAPGTTQGQATALCPPGSRGPEQAGSRRGSAGARAPSGPSRGPLRPPLSILRAPPLPPRVGVPVRTVLGSREVSPGRAQRRPAAAGSPARPLLMACRARSTAAAATAAPSSSSSSRAPSRDAANAPAPQSSSSSRLPASPPPRRGPSRLQRRPARSRASGSQRRPAPGPGVAAAAARLPAPLPAPAVPAPL